MISVQLLPQQDVVDQLEALGCTKFLQIDSEIALWRTPWGFPFSVPELGEDKMCPRSVLLRILDDIERSRPAQH